MRETKLHITCDVCGNESTPKIYRIEVQAAFDSADPGIDHEYKDVCHNCFILIMQTLNQLNKRVKEVK